MTTPAAALIFLLSFLAGVVPTAGAEPTPSAPGDASMDELVMTIPAGQDELMADIVGRGETLPGDCKFTGGQVEGALIRASYACSGGEVVYELRHPSAAPSGAITTAQFAVVLRSGSPPAGFADALVSRIRSREAAFQWTQVGPPRAQVSVSTVVLVGAGVLALAAVAWAVRRRASARRRGQH